MKIKKEKMKSIITSAIMLVGALVCLYPAISNYFAEKNHAEILETYTEAVESLSEETIAEEFAKAQEYNENLSGDPVHDPFIGGSGYTIPGNYEEVLNINGDGVMGYIDIPSISAYLPIYHGTDSDTLLKGVGHIEQSSLPIGGVSTHSVLTGHTGVPTSELFTKISKLEVGDVFYIHVLNKTLKYEIYETKVIEPEDISELTIEEGRDLVTLVTCTPYGVNSHRLLVKGERTADDEEITETTGDITTNSYKYLILICVLVIIIIIAIIIIIFVINDIKINRKAKHLKRRRNNRNRRR